MIQQNLVSHTEFDIYVFLLQSFTNNLLSNVTFKNLKTRLNFIKFLYFIHFKI